MTAWTVQCHYAAYHARTETIEAETLEDACTRAVARANAIDGWTALDHHCGPTFVAAVAEGEGADPWGPDALPVPGRFTERGEPPLLTLSGDVSPGTVSVERGTVRLRFERAAGTVEAGVSDGAPSPSPPLVVVGRRPDGRPAVSVSGGRVRVRIEDGA